MDMELIRAKVVVALDALRTKKAGLEKELLEERASNSAAWGAHGSELCAGSMLAEERGLVNRITRAQQEIDTLEAFLRGEINLDARATTVLEIADVDAKIEALERTKKEFEAYIARVDLVLAYAKADFQPIAI